MTKYKQYVARMLENNKELFDGFRKLHDRYASDQEKYQEEFNKEGERVSAVIRVFPLIDHIGLIIQPFAIKKITL